MCTPLPPAGDLPDGLKFFFCTVDAGRSWTWFSNETEFEGVRWGEESKGAGICPKFVSQLKGELWPRKGLLPLWVGIWSSVNLKASWWLWCISRALSYRSTSTTDKKPSPFFLVCYIIGLKIIGSNLRWKFICLTDSNSGSEELDNAFHLNKVIKTIKIIESWLPVLFIEQLFSDLWLWLSNQGVEGLCSKSHFTSASCGSSGWMRALPLQPCTRAALRVIGKNESNSILGLFL